MDRNAAFEQIKKILESKEDHFCILIKGFEPSNKEYSSGKIEAKDLEHLIKKLAVEFDAMPEGKFYYQLWKNSNAASSNSNPYTNYFTVGSSSTSAIGTPQVNTNASKLWTEEQLLERIRLEKELSDARNQNERLKEKYEFQTKINELQKSIDKLGEKDQKSLDFNALKEFWLMAQNNGNPQPQTAVNPTQTPAVGTPEVGDHEKIAADNIQKIINKTSPQAFFSALESLSNMDSNMLNAIMSNLPK